MKVTKERRFRSRGEAYSGPPTLLPLRGGDLVGVVEVLGDLLDDDEALFRLFGFVAWAFAPEQLIFVSDSYGTSERVNPMTGERWKAGELHDVVTHHQGRERGWVTDVMFAMVVNRGDEYAIVEVPYTHDGSDLVWGDVRTFLPGSREHAALGGRMPEFLLRAMEGPTVVSQMPGSAMPSSPEEEEMMWAVLDMSGADRLGQAWPTTTVVLMAEEGSLREAALREGLPG